MYVVLQCYFLIHLYIAVKCLGSDLCSALFLAVCLLLLTCTESNLKPESDPLCAFTYFASEADSDSELQVGSRVADRVYDIAR